MSTNTGPDCLARMESTNTPSRSFDRATARTPVRLLLAARSRTRALEAPGFTYQAPENHSGSASSSPISEVHRDMGHVASEVSPRGTHPCCVASRPATLTPRPKPAGFQAAECRSSALLTGWVRSRFGTVSLVSHQQALAGLSWLNFSPPADLPLVAGMLVPDGLRRRSHAPHAGSR